MKIHNNGKKMCKAVQRLLVMNATACFVHVLPAQQAAHAMAQCCCAALMLQSFEECCMKCCAEINYSTVNPSVLHILLFLCRRVCCGPPLR
jgi:hypothetical protein